MKNHHINKKIKNRKPANVKSFNPIKRQKALWAFRQVAMASNDTIDILKQEYRKQISKYVEGGITPTTHNWDIKLEGITDLSQISIRDWKNPAKIRPATEEDLFHIHIRLVPIRLE